MAYMEVLLNEDVDHLGHRGQVVRVRAGYGRNYLLPQGLAVEASTGNKRMIEEQKRVLAKRENRERTSAAKQGEALAGVELVFDRKVGEHGLLYGSVTSLDIAEALKERGFGVERRKISLREPIKEVGEYDVTVKLHREITPVLKIVVRKEGGEETAAEQTQSAAQEAAGEAGEGAESGDSGE